MYRTPEPPDLPPAMCSFTCDWGDCDRETVAWRWAGQQLGQSPLGWLPVCAVHAKHGKVSAQSDGSGLGTEAEPAARDN